MKELTEKIKEVAQSLGKADISMEELLDEFAAAQAASLRLAEAVRSHFVFKAKGGSRKPIDEELTEALWEVDRYFNQTQKRKDKAEKAALKKP